MLRVVVRRIKGNRIVRRVAAVCLAVGVAVATIIACSDAITPERRLIELFLAPSSVNIAPNTTAQFVVTGSWTDGSDLIPNVTFEFTGGTMNATGLYTAGASEGTFSVIATAVGAEIADTAQVTITATPPVLEAVILSPPASTVQPGGAIQFSVTGDWSDGSTTAPIVGYEATGGTITPQGLYTAGATLGSFSVIATQFGGTKADTAPITIEPQPPSAAFLTEDFSTYLHTLHFHTDPRNIYNNEEFGGPWGQWNRITIDTTTGVADIGAGTSTRSMKYTWPDRTNATGIQPDAPRCVDFYILKVIPFTPIPEAWAEIYVKFSSNWTTKAPAAWACPSNPDYKFLFLGTLPSTRFSLKNDYAGIGNRWDPTAPGQGDGDNNFINNVWHDDQWHRIRWHVKLALLGQPGIHEVWLDNVKVFSQALPTTLSQTGINGLYMGNNMNQGPGQVQTLHWGQIKLYSTNPGW